MRKVFVAVQGPIALRIIALALALVSRSAFAQAPPSESETPPSESETSDTPRPLNGNSLLPVRLDLHGVLTWEGELGTGLRVDIPVFGTTGIHYGRDEIALSIGCDVSFVTFNGDGRVTWWPTLAAHWSMEVTKRFVFYPELGIVAQVRDGTFEGLFPNVGFGGRVSVYRSLAVFGRLGWPMAVSIGLTF